MKLKRKRNFFVLALLVTLTTFMYLFISIYDTKYTKSKEKFQIYEVQPGDTLWKIAAGLNLDKDIRETVHEIRKINGISPVIKPGQKIIVPAQN